MSKRIGFVYRNGNKSMARALNEELDEKYYSVISLAESILDITRDKWVKNKWIKEESYETYVKQSHRDIFSKVKAITLKELIQDVDDFYKKMDEVDEKCFKAGAIGISQDFVDYLKKKNNERAEAERRKRMAKEAFLNE